MDPAARTEARDTPTPASSYPAPGGGTGRRTDASGGGPGRGGTPEGRGLAELAHGPRTNTRAAVSPAAS